MLSVSFYIIGCSLKNRLRRWLRRLREPRYAIFGGAGVLYLGFLGVLRFHAVNIQQQPGAGPSPIDALPSLAATGPTLAGVVVLGFAAAAWLTPGGSLLQFTRAEVQFLFPAPMSRRTLVAYRMLRSQLGLLFGSFISALVLPSASGSMRLRVGLTLWLLLFTAKTYFAGVAITKGHLSVSASPRSRQIARATIAAIVGAFVIVMALLVRIVYGPTPLTPAEAIGRFAFDQLPAVAQVLLWPCAALVRPLFTADWVAFRFAIGGSMTVLAVVSAWVLTADDSFERVAAEAGFKREQEKGKPRYRASKTAWNLAPLGRPETAFAWKGALQTFRVVDRRIVVRVLAVAVWVVIVIMSSNQRESLATIAGLFVTTAAGMAVFLGPLMLRLDFRQDLEHLELLKTWPVPSAAVVRGMILWPMTLLTLIAWLMTFFALVLSSAVFEDSRPAVRVAVALAAMIAAPALISAQLVTHNAAALAFPAWMGSGQQRSRGIDAIGQRLLLVAGGLAVLAVSAFPGALVGTVVWFAVAPFAGIAALPPAAVAFTAVIAGEVFLATGALGPMYEKLDLLAVERTE